ncbi:MAG TPA: HEPN domain-containing protein [Terriglobia bacterium]|nr:HEPN domain-containing protein [Terriglobia bacterium]
MASEIEAHIDLAKEMLQGAELDIANRFPRGASSRAYMVMEHAARSMLLAEGERLGKHQAVIGEFGRLFAKPARVDAKFHRYLIDDFDLRNVAEYDPLPDPPVTMDRAMEALEHAREFLDMAERFLKGREGL